MMFAFAAAPCLLNHYTKKGNCNLLTFVYTQIEKKGGGGESEALETALF